MLLPHAPAALLATPAHHHRIFSYALALRHDLGLPLPPLSRRLHEPSKTWRRRTHCSCERTSLCPPAPHAVVLLALGESGDEEPTPHYYLQQWCHRRQETSCWRKLECHPPPPRSFARLSRCRRVQPHVVALRLFQFQIANEVSPSQRI
uniref:Uncharacterized protein n=1 Tax=Zea mays TaxID=4577 RepID=A0A804QD03_MAIZE